MSEWLAGKRVLVTGVNGQVGRALTEQLNGQCDLITAARGSADIHLDLANSDQICSVMDELKPDIVINPAAYTQVDQAEDEPELAARINGFAPGVLAEACKKHDATLVHYSTDYVFAGTATEPYKESDPTAPVNTYGQSKLQGEQAIQAVACKHLIFRTCWVYDAVGRNFPNAILGRARTMETLKVVDDQQGTPTWAGFIADMTQQALIQSQRSGIHASNANRIYHLRPEGNCSWYDFAEAVVAFTQQQEALAVREILPVSSSEFPTKAARPAWSVLDIAKLKADFGLMPDGWSAYMERCFS